MKRPYPGFAIGLFYDSLWLGFDRDELHNGDAGDQAAFNPDFPPNQVVTEQVMAKIDAGGEAFFTGTRKGKRCMRVSVSSWKTTDHDVQRAVAAIAASL